MIGRIYKIVNDNTDQIYIGSTCNDLKVRLSKHKTDLNMYNDGNRNYRTSFIILNGENPKIELLEEFEYNDKKELLEKEREYIINNENICVNSHLPCSEKYESIYCEDCNCFLGKSSLNNHKKTKKHINNINN